MSTLHLLPTQTKMDPTAPEDATYFADDLVGYVMRTERGTLRLATSAGRGDLDLGDTRLVRHDQTGRSLGTWTVVGIASFADGTREGDVPAGALGHLVFK